eukprot:CAMPEP_0115007438 /NCGR_PEP_ID=MMETSP0216-20121206/21186_1 /TAXON_ID=223996 /ORGANISM="Protocruzia adherens, Strain Boccale" /LENGTH=533 /DNA_ID=CAMNT_0002374393 /DNA_START=36 /DNA_END=1637 /DNA_ORIENTATION=-
MAAIERALWSCFTVLLLVSVSATNSFSDNSSQQDGTATTTDFTGLYMVLSNKAAGIFFENAVINTMGAVKDFPLNQGKAASKHIFGVDEWETNLVMSNIVLKSIKSATVDNEFQFTEPSGFTLGLTNVEADVFFNYNVTAPYVGYPGDATLMFEKLRLDIDIQLPANEIKIQSLKISENPGVLAYDISNGVWDDILNMLATDMKSFITDKTLDTMSPKLQAIVQLMASNIKKQIPVYKALKLDVDWPSAVTLKNEKFMMIPMKGNFLTSKTTVTPKTTLPTPTIDIQSSDDVQAYVSDFSLESLFLVTAADQPLVLPPTPLEIPGFATVTTKSENFRDLFPPVGGNAEWGKVYPDNPDVYLSVSNEGCTDASVTIDETDYITANTSLLFSVYVKAEDSKDEPTKAVTVKVPMKLTQLELVAENSTISSKLNGSVTFTGDFTSIYTVSEDLKLDLATMKTKWNTQLTGIIKLFISSLKHDFKEVTFDKVVYQKDFAVLGGTIASKSSESMIIKDTEHAVASENVLKYTRMYEEL